MSRTILLADDSVTIQKVIELTFMDEDWEVVAVGNGDEALEKLDEMTPDFVIADVHMPGASGYDVSKQSKSLRPEVPVLLLVSTFEPFDEDEAERSGCDAFLKKPFDSQELQRLVEELSAEAAGETPRRPAEPEVESEATEETAVEVEAEPFAIGLGEEDDEPPTRVPPPSEPVTAEAQRGVFELAPEDVEAAESIGLAEDEEEPAAEAAAPEPPPPPSPQPKPEPAAPIHVESPLSDDDVERIARRVVELLGDRPVRDVAWEVVPDLAEVVIRDRLRELESQVDAAD